LSIGIDFGIGIDQNSWYRTGIVSNPKKLVSPITTICYSPPPPPPPRFTILRNFTCLNNMIEVQNSTEDWQPIILKLGLKFHVLNKDYYGYLIEPMPGRTTLHDAHIKFQHVKLELIGKRLRNRVGSFIKGVKPRTDKQVVPDKFPWQVYFLVCTVNKFSLTSLLSRVYGQQVFLDKFTFLCVQSTSFPWQVFFLVCTVNKLSFVQVYFLVCTVNKFSLTSLLSRVYGQQVFLDKFPWQSFLFVCTEFC
jgi:hypothetical protein